MHKGIDILFMALELTLCKILITKNRKEKEIDVKQVYFSIFIRK